MTTKLSNNGISLHNFALKSCKWLFYLYLSAIIYQQKHEIMKARRKSTRVFMPALIWISLAFLMPVAANAGTTSVLPGDSNCDGAVNVMDAITTVNYITGNNPQPFCFENADVNGDGTIDVMDVIGTVNIILGGGGFECGVSTVTDADGNVYNTVLIGNQCWMLENLRTTKYRDGTSIPNVTNGSTWVNLTSGAYCWYDNNISWKDVYGALYNWYAIDQASNGNNHLCPEGWKVPSDADFTALSTYLGGTLTGAGKMKEEGYQHWQYPNTGATNESGFTALPGGSRVWNGGFSEMNRYNWLWTSTTQETIFAYLRNLRHNSAILARGSINKNNGQTVRCLKE